MYKKIFGLIVAMLMLATSAFAVDIAKNKTIASSTSVASITYTCTEANGIALKLIPSVATLTSEIHYIKNGVATITVPHVDAGSFVTSWLQNGETFSMVASETVAFTMLSIPLTMIASTNTPLTQTLVASTVAVVAMEPVKFNMVAQPGSPSLFLRYSTTDFATNTVGTNLQGGSTIGFDLASGSLVTMFSSTGITNYAYSFSTSYTASHTTSGTQWFGAVANVINFTGTEAVSLQMSGASADCFVVKNASATVLSPTKVPSNGTYTVELFTGDYISFISAHVGYMTIIGRIAGGASAPLVLNSRTLTNTFTSSTPRTITFRNKVPKRVMITAASQTAFIEINGTASTTSSILKATPTVPFVKRLMPNDTISTVGTAPIKITIRSVPIGR